MTIQDKAPVNWVSRRASCTIDDVFQALLRRVEQDVTEIDRIRNDSEVWTIDRITSASEIYTRTASLLTLKISISTSSQSKDQRSWVTPRKRNS